MVTAYPLLLSGIRIGPLQLRNRLVMGAMHTRLEHDVGAYAAFLSARAEGGAALLITGGHAPTDDGRIDASAPVLRADSDIDGHRIWCEAVHARGALMGMQLLHAGRYADLEQSVAPSPVAWGARRAPRELTTREIADLIDSFAAAAGRARDAGYDAVEIMGSEGYLVHQFAARFTNRRTDSYGGTWEGRRRFAVEVVRAVREAIGVDMALLFRISARDLLADGLTAEESADLARAVVAAGADALDTGIGWHESSVPTIAGAVPRAAWAADTRRLREVAGVPVIATNRITTPADAERLLREGAADLIALARPLLADPEFAAKAAAGREALITTCVACNQSCLDRVLAGDTVRCLVNPRTGRESAPGDFSNVRQHIAVIGGGPAGMSCALTLAENGHRVTLYEAADALGGQLRLAMVVPGKGEFSHYVESARARLEDLGVTMRLGETATAADIVAAGVDHVVVATGLRPQIPDAPRVVDHSVVTYAQVLSGEVRVGDSVAVLGAGGVGFDVALYLSGDSAPSQDVEAFRRYWDLAEEGESEVTERTWGTGRQITLFQRSHGRMGGSLGLSTGWVLKRQLQRAGVTMISGAHYGEVEDGLFSYRDDHDVAHSMAVDHVVLCTGQVSNDGLYAQLRDLHPSVHLIGGARSPRGMDAALAIAEGSDAARSIAGAVLTAP